MRIVFATHNSGKVKEIKEIMAGLDVEVISADEAGITEEISETGTTFAENALLKAGFVWGRLGGWVMADDSGICVEALNGKPGVYSARWAGENAPGEKWVEKMLWEMRNVSNGKRKAWFETAAFLFFPNYGCRLFEGVVRGTITMSLRGTFNPKLPYDVIFQPEGGSRTFAEMTSVEKNALSHRGQAFLKLKDFLVG